MEGRRDEIVSIALKRMEFYMLHRFKEDAAVTAIREIVVMDGFTGHHNFACYCIALRRIALHRMYGLYPPFNKVIALAN
jgi:hypothetical protein